MSEQYKCNRKYILSDLDSTFAVLSNEETVSVYGGDTAAAIAEQRAFQSLLAKIKNDHASRQVFITALRQQATDNKNAFN